MVMRSISIVYLGLLSISPLQAMVGGGRLPQRVDLRPQQPSTQKNSPGAATTPAEQKKNQGGSPANDTKSDIQNQETAANQAVQPPKPQLDLHVRSYLAHDICKKAYLAPETTSENREYARVGIEYWNQFHKSGNQLAQKRLLVIAQTLEERKKSAPIVRIVPEVVRHESQRLGMCMPARARIEGSPIEKQVVDEAWPVLEAAATTSSKLGNLHGMIRDLCDLATLTIHAAMHLGVNQQLQRAFSLIEWAQELVTLAQSCATTPVNKETATRAVQPPTRNFTAAMAATIETLKTAAELSKSPAQSTTLRNTASSLHGDDELSEKTLLSLLDLSGASNPNLRALTTLISRVINTCKQHGIVQTICREAAPQQKDSSIVSAEQPHLSQATSTVVEP